MGEAGGAPALVTGDADQPAVTAPAPAVYMPEVYSDCHVQLWHVTCYLMAHGDVIMTASCVKYCHQYRFALYLDLSIINRQKKKFHNDFPLLLIHSKLQMCKSYSHMIFKIQQPGK